MILTPKIQTKGTPMKAERSRRFGKYQAEVRCGSARRRCLMGGSYEHERRKSRIARWRLFILHGGTEKFFGTLISFFRSFISFFRTFISALGEEFSFSRELAGISSVGSVIRSRESVFLIGRGRIYNSSLERILSMDGSMCSSHRIVWRKLSTI